MFPIQPHGGLRIVGDRDSHITEPGHAYIDGTDELLRLVDVIERPFDERPGLEGFAAPAPGGFGPYRTFCGT